MCNVGLGKFPLITNNYGSFLLSKSTAGGLHPGRVSAEHVPRHRHLQAACSENISVFIGNKTS